MTRYRLVQRGLRMVATLLAVSFVTFALMSFLPGDAAQTILGPTADPEALEALRDQMHLNGPLLQRYFEWLFAALQGDLGTSVTLGQSVTSLIGTRLLVTLELIFFSALLSLVISIPLGILCAYRPQNMLSRAVRGISFMLLSVPPFVIGVLLVGIFALDMSILPPAGWVPLDESVIGNLEHVVLPVITLSLGQIAIFTQMLRGDMAATLEQDYVSFADAKGLPTRRILFVHAFKPSAFSLFTLAGAQLGYLIGGTVIVEVLFNLPGLGSALTSSIAQRDLVAVQGITLFMAAAFVLVNFFVDVLYGVLDPRIRVNHGAAAH